MISPRRILKEYLFYMKVALYVCIFLSIFFIIYYSVKTNTVLSSFAGAFAGLLASVTVELVSTYFLKRNYKKVRQNLPYDHFLPERFEEFMKLTHELESLKIKIEQGQFYATGPDNSRQPLKMSEVYEQLERRRNELLVNSLDITPAVLWQLLKRLTTTTSFPNPPSQTPPHYADQKSVAVR